jgi:cytochrome c556
MRMAALTVLVAVASAGSAIGQSAKPAPAPAAMPRPVGTMSDLMVHLIRPTSDAVFYITSRTPSSEAEWGVLQAQTLTLAEAGHLLLMPSRARGRAQWQADATLMLEAGRKAFAAAKAKDVAALEALNDELYQSCVTCHQHFRPGYGKRPGAPAPMR